MNKVFIYGGYHFVPHRKFHRRKSEKDFFAVNQKLRTDWGLGMFSDQHRAEHKTVYNYDDFYAASTDKECDIFRCIENDRLYVPGANELFEFVETRKHKSEQHYS